MLGRYLPFLRASSVSDYTRTNTHLKNNHPETHEVAVHGLGVRPPGSAVLCCAVLVGSSPTSRARQRPLLDSLVPAGRVGAGRDCRGGSFTALA